MSGGWMVRLCVGVCEHWDNMFVGMAGCCVTSVKLCDVEKALYFAGPRIAKRKVNSITHLNILPLESRFRDLIFRNSRKISNNSDV